MFLPLIRKNIFILCSNSSTIEHFKLCHAFMSLMFPQVKLIVVPQSSLRALIKTAADFGYKGIDIEVGPTAAAALYDTPEDVPVQAILLSTYHKQFTPQYVDFSNPLFQQTFNRINNSFSTSLHFLLLDYFIFRFAGCVKIFSFLRRD